MMICHRWVPLNLRIALLGDFSYYFKSRSIPVFFLFFTSPKAFFWPEIIVLKGNRGVGGSDTILSKCWMISTFFF